jgi:hypothetical protein
MNHSRAVRTYEMQMVPHLSHAAQITALSMAGLGVMTSLLSLFL